ncbi:MerR family transcriptional regulator [Alteribacter lacisalsi]|uniref:MerR family transcriptional regulator n=1 Tax=Alteribacter lacisalsi TaxID=2045244 RepID=A0A2W0HT30_9BACI|nr:MerR family transcriptional regulator [Alteribacter lacisalsi]PYZ96758.1 MerR family transcriptional regulator [Alteribacter lacisalsi]
MKQQSMFTIREFGRRAGVTERTLRFYEEKGLLIASKQNSAGHRLYGIAELKKLQQIQSLKFIGLSLEEIRQLIEKDDAAVMELGPSLETQHTLLTEKRDELNRAIEAVERVQFLIEEGKSVTWPVITSLLFQTEHEDEQREWMKEHFSDEMAALFFSFPKEQRQQIDLDMMDVLATVKQLMKDQVPPRSEEAFNLLAKLTEAVTKHVDSPETFAKLAEKSDTTQASAEVEFQFPNFFTSEEEAYLEAIGKEMEKMYEESQADKS